MAELSEGAGTRPGGRSARVRAAVHRAVQDLVAEGVRTEDLTIPVVAARAGVHATTVYRRWGSLAELLAAVAEHRFTGDVVVPDTGGLAGDLERWATDVARDLADPDTLALMRASIGAGEAASCACTADRRAQITAMLDHERRRGGDVPDVDAVVDGVLAPLYYRALFEPASPGHDGGPAPEHRVRVLVGNVLDRASGATGERHRASGATGERHRAGGATGERHRASGATGERLGQAVSVSP